MMNNLIINNNLSRLIFLLIFYISIPLLAQNESELEVRYTMKYIPDSLNMEKVHYVDNMILLLNSKESIYYSEDAKKYYDYIYKGISTMSNGNISLSNMPSIPKVKGSVYKKNDLLLVTIPVGLYLYEFEEPKLNWKLLNEQKLINGINCNLATVVTDTGDTFFAWYSTNYPFSEGPFRFKGLPGLAIKVWNKSNTIEFNTTSIKKVALPIEKYNANRSMKLKSKEQFLKARNNYNSDPNAQSKNMPNIIIKDSSGEIIKPSKLEKITNNVFID